MGGRGGQRRETRLFLQEDQGSTARARSQPTHREPERGTKTVGTQSFLQTQPPAKREQQRRDQLTNINLLKKKKKGP